MQDFSLDSYDLLKERRHLGVCKDGKIILGESPWWDSNHLVCLHHLAKPINHQTGHGRDSVTVDLIIPSGLVLYHDWLGRQNDFYDHRRVQRDPGVWSLCLLYPGPKKRQKKKRFRENKQLCCRLCSLRMMIWEIVYIYLFEIVSFLGLMKVGR